MNERLHDMMMEATKDMPECYYVPGEYFEKFAELIVRECASEYNKLINGESVVLPKDREHAEALVRVGMFYLENNK